MNMPQTQRLLDRVQVRHFAALLAVRFRRAWLIAAGVALVLVMLARLLALISNQAVLIALAVLAAVPLLFTLAVTRRPKPKQVARLIDERTGSKELFLTAALLDETPGDFQPLVREQVEQRAGEVAAARIVPCRWQRGLGDVLGSGALVAVAVFFLPQLDPFKKQAQRDKAAQQAQELEKTKKATVVRAEQIKEGDNRTSEEVKKALAALEKTFKEAKPVQPEATLKELADEQKQLGEMWRQAANQQRNDAFDKGAQQFGAVDPQKAEQWREDLKKGDFSAIKKEMESMRAEMQKLADLADSAEKRAAQEQLAQRLNSLADGMKQVANSPQLQAALQRAMQQLDMSKLGQLSKESLEAAQQSMQLSEKELEQLAQSMGDLKNLEDALKDLQMAKQLAGQGKLDGENTGDCKTMSDYQALFDKLLNHESDNLGPLGPNPGRGQGGKAPENDDAETEFKSEKSPTQLAGGKMLLQWKVDETGPTGARADDYRNAVRQVKQGVSEAIANEQVPPGYHEAIQKYFDTLPDAQPPVPPAAK